MKVLHGTLVLTALLSSGIPSYAAAPAPRVRAVAAQTDAELADRINHRLDTSSMIWKYDVKASVNGGGATLTGTVANAAQKAEATRLAHVTGISSVRNDVKVDPGTDRSLVEKTKSGLSKTGDSITDAWITTKVRYHFTGEDLLKGSDINVDTNNHVVTLKGTVASAAGRARAVLLARQTEGVARVVDQLMISAKH